MLRDSVETGRDERPQSYLPALVFIHNGPLVPSFGLVVLFFECDIVQLKLSLRIDAAREPKHTLTNSRKLSRELSMADCP